jgi:hypothetical protein
MDSAIEVADIFRRHGEAFRFTHADHLGYVERRVMGAITACRTAALGGHVEQFDPHVVDTKWLAEQVAALAKKWSRKPAAKRARRA